MGVNSTLGPILIGCAFSWGFFGVLCLQTFLYFQWYPTDHRLMKAFVLFLLVLECAETAVSTHVTWHFTISGWGNPAVLVSSPVTFSAAVILTSIVACLAQVFFARRLRLLSMNVYICFIILVIAACQLTAAIIGVVQVLEFKTKKHSSLSTFDAFSIWLGTSAGCDILIAGGMVYYLARTRSRILIKTKYDVMTRLIGQSLQTGAFTALGALLNLAFFLGFKTNNIQDIPFFILGKLYSNTVLANLNSRQSLVNAGLYFSGGGTTTTSGGVFTDPVDISLRVHSDIQAMMIDHATQFEMVTRPTSMSMGGSGGVNDNVRHSRSIK